MTRDTATVRTDLLARLGLDGGADDQAVEAAHARITEFLSAAPDDLDRWASRRQQEADRIHTLLTGPATALASAVAATNAKAAQARPGQRRAGSPTAATATTQAAGRNRKPFLWAGALIVAIAVVFGVWYSGRPAVPDLTKADTSSSAATSSLDPAKVAAFMKKITANPKDTVSLLGLADLYYNAGDFANAKTFLNKVIAYDPKNERALLGLGAASYNSGDAKTAEAAWTKVAAQDPKNPEVHYDLGFLYMTTKRTALMKAEWAQVVALAPNSDMAKNVQSQVGSTTPTASATK